MRLSVSLFVAALAALPAAGQSHIAPTDPKTPAEELKSFKLPPGFAAQLVASEPDIGKPIQIAFDARGRLWVTTSRHYPFPAADGKPSDKLYVLSDFGPDGKAKKVEVFADDLNIPIGILPLPDCKSCLVSEVGRIVKLTDTDGDGKADQREPILTGFGSKDTHGMTNSFVLLPDGWVYACHGFANESKITAKDGSQVKMHSGNTYRFRPDGSRVEPWTFGQVNPFGMTVDPWLNLYTADCHSKPITQLIRGAYYDSFGKPHDGLGYGPHATRHDHGSTALCGLAWYEADHFPKEWNGCMFLGNVVTNRINADRIEWKGSTPVAKELPDFLVSSDPWFRPTDIKLGPDGALYVADFYNRIIGHYEVDLKHPGRDRDRGRVWRIVYTGEGVRGKAEGPKDLSELAVSDLYQVLDESNLALRSAAALQLIHRGDELVEWMEKDRGITPKRPYSGAADAFAPWVIARTMQNGYLGTYAALTMQDPGYRPNQVCSMLKVLGSVEDMDGRTPPSEALAPFRERLRHDNGHVRAAAVDGLLSHPHPDNVGPLVKLLQSCPAEDTHLRHAARIALRNALRDAPGAWAEAEKADPAVIADVALGIPSPRAAEFLLKRLQAGHSDPKTCEHIGRYGDNAQAVVAVTVFRGRPADVFGLQALLRGLQTRGAQMPDDVPNVVLMACLAGLTSPDPAKVVASAELAGQWKLDAVAHPLAELVENRGGPEPVRAAALMALAVADPDRSVATVASVLSDPSAPAALRDKAAQALGGVDHAAARETLLAAMPTAPARLAASVALALAGSPDGATALLDAVAAGKASPRLLQDPALLRKLKSARVPDLDSRVAELTKGLPSPDARVAELLKARAAGFARANPDLAQGKRVFTQHCAACHQIGGEGAKIGPQLDGIGNRGADRLLEDILDPSRNVDAEFHTRTLELTDGRAITGLSRGTEGNVWVLFDSAGKELRIPLDDVEAQRQSPLSPMPANFDAAIPEAEFYHLLAYLLARQER